jgi:hypothetical protein
MTALSNNPLCRKILSREKDHRSLLAQRAREYFATFDGEIAHRLFQSSLAQLRIHDISVVIE